MRFGTAKTAVTQSDRPVASGRASYGDSDVHPNGGGGI